MIILLIFSLLLFIFALIFRNSVVNHIEQTKESTYDYDKHIEKELLLKEGDKVFYKNGYVEFIGIHRPDPIKCVIKIGNTGTFADFHLVLFQDIEIKSLKRKEKIDIILSES
jgi:hypothetical protein